MEVLKIIRRLTIVGAFCITLAAFAAVAYVISRHEEYSLQQQLIVDGQVSQSYFSPEDDLRSLLISLIDAEQQQILFAIYTFTEKNIAQALIRATNRGVQVQGVVDRSYGHSRYSKVGMLANAQVPISVYQTSANERQAGLMHNKFMIFSKNIAGKSLLWTGSYNFTNRASCKNQENALILDNPHIIRQFEQYFARLQSHSLPISGRLLPQRQGCATV